MKIEQSGARPSWKGEAANFSGGVWVDEIVAGEARVHLLRVTFLPGARTCWHSHPRGQVLHVLSGRGLAQVAGGAVQVILPGHTLRFDPGELHWHGAAPHSTMVHLAMQETTAEGHEVDWGPLVSNAEYVDPQG